MAVWRLFRGTSRRGERRQSFDSWHEIYSYPGQKQWAFPPIHSWGNITTGSFKLGNIAKTTKCFPLFRCGAQDCQDPSPSILGTFTGATAVQSNPTITLLPCLIQHYQLKLQHLVSRGSEHQLAGVAFPMEMHLVHFNAKYASLSISCLLVFYAVVSYSRVGWMSQFVWSFTPNKNVQHFCTP